jgi:hemerythrin superfamily protein
MTNAITIIKRDHRAVKTDYKKFQGARTDSEKQKIAAKIFDALDAHAKMEETLFYPAVRAEANAKARNMIDSSLAEHTEMKTLIKRFRSEKEEEGFGMKIDELLAGVMHHVKEEENVLLPEVKKHMKEERLQELGDDMEKLSPSRGQTLGAQVTERLQAEGEALIAPE